MTNIFSIEAWIVIGIIALCIYFIPSIVAIGKKYSAAITVLNIFLGWTFFGWVGSLIWAIASPKKEDVKMPTQIIEVNNIIPRDLSNISPNSRQINESNDRSNDVPTLVEWRKSNPHRGINDYYAKYGNRTRQ